MASPPSPNGILALPYQTHPRHSLSISDFGNSISPSAAPPPPLALKIVTSSQRLSCSRFPALQIVLRLVAFSFPPIRALSPPPAPAFAASGRRSAQQPATAGTCVCSTREAAGPASPAVPQPRCSLPLADVAAHHREPPPRAHTGPASWPPRFRFNITRCILIPPPSRTRATPFPCFSSLDCTVERSASFTDWFPLQNSTTRWDPAPAEGFPVHCPPVVRSEPTAQLRKLRKEHSF